MTKRLMVSQTSNRLLDPGYKYDAAGNLVAAPGGCTYSYNAENRMLTATVPQTSVTTYSYDGDGRRMKKVVTQGTTVTVTRFVYGPTGTLVAEYEGGKIRGFLIIPIELTKWITI